jgi:hypothetical protein
VKSALQLVGASLLALVFVAPNIATPNQPEIEHDAVLISCGSKGISVDASLSHYRGEPVTGVDILTPKKH